MPSYFPSKKVLVVGVLAIGLLAWSIVYQNTSQKSSAITNNPLRTVAQAESAFPDTDGDGLYNWEETLYGTDITNPDSDGDGVMDGEQYLSKPESILVRLSDSVYSAVNLLGEEVKNTKDPVSLLSTEPKKYDNPFHSYNLILVPDTEENIQKYILETMFALSNHEPVMKKDPLDLADEWFETKSPSTLKEIEELNAVTKDVASSLTKINVPEKYLEIHLKIANNLYLSGLSLDDIKLTTLDPMAGFFAAANYVNYQSKYLETIDELIGFGATSNE